MFVCLYLFIFTGELPLVEYRHKLCVGHPFFLSLGLHFNTEAMSNVRGKGGKLIGEGRGVGVDGDVAGTRQGGKGSGSGRGVSVTGGTLNKNFGNCWRNVKTIGFLLRWKKS